jgi:hypothetical protein
MKGGGVWGEEKNISLVEIPLCIGAEPVQLKANI